VSLRGCKEAADLTLEFVAHVGEAATQTIRERLKPVGIDVILVHRLLTIPVPVPEYLLLTELEGSGPVRGFCVDMEGLEGAAPPLPAPTWRGRLGRGVRRRCVPAVHVRPSTPPPRGSGGCVATVVE
jgi:hypothetical protein